MDAEEAAPDAPVVVLGASGLLGRAVRSDLEQSGHVVLGVSCSRAGPGLEQVDLTAGAAPLPENGAVWAFPELEALLDRARPRAVFNCAAERRPDHVQADPSAAEALNVHLPHAVARWCAAQSQPPLHVHLSTDYVFDGTSPPYAPDAPTNPLNAYGQSKARAERAVLSAGPEGRTIIVRVPILYGQVELNGESAVSVLLDAVCLPRTAGEASLQMDANQTRYPTCVEDVARTMTQLLALTSPPPILHVSAQEAMTKYIMSIVLARVWNGARTRAWRELASTTVEGGAGDLDEDREDDSPAASADHLQPLYDTDLLAATARPLNARLDVSTNGKLGLSTDFVEFDTWWAEYLFEKEKQHVNLVIEQRKRAADENRKALEEEAERKRRDEEERLAREAAEAAAAEERRKQEEAEAEERRKQEEAEAVERCRREEADAEERRKQEEAEAEERKKREATEADEREKKQTEAEEFHKTGAVENEECQQEEDAEAEDPEKAQQVKSLHRPPTLEAAQAESNGVAASGELQNSSPDDSEHTEQATENSDGADTVIEAGPPAGQIKVGDRSTSPALPALTVHPREIAPTSPLEEAEKMVRAPSQARTLSPDPSFNSLTAHPTPPGTSPLATPKDDDEDDPKDDAPLGSLLAVRGRQGKPTGEADSDSERYGAPSPTTHAEPSAPGLVDQPAESVSLSTASHVTRGPGGHPPKAWFEIKVGDPQTVGAPMSAHTVYTVRTRTDSERFAVLQFSVLRRYSDFRWLHAALVHNHPGVIIPPVPEKVKLGRFNPELVEARRTGLELCINRIANHAELQKDDDLVLFLSSENFSTDVRARDLIKGPVPTPEQRTYLGWGSSLVSVAGAGGPRFVETDEWFDKQRVYLNSLETHLRTLFKATHTLSEERRHRAKAEQELAKHYAALSTSSLSRATCTCFAGVGEVTALTARSGDVQAEADGHDLAVIVYEYERMVGSVRKAFQTREDAWIAWRRAADDLSKVVAKHERFRDEGLYADRHDLVEREAEAMHLYNRFEAISRTCKSEVANFDHERVKDIRSALAAWVQGMIHRQQEMVHEWEEYAALVARQTHGHKPASSVVSPLDRAAAPTSVSGAPTNAAPAPTDAAPAPPNAAPAPTNAAPAPTDAAPAPTDAAPAPTNAAPAPTNAAPAPTNAEPAPTPGGTATSAHPSDKQTVSSTPVSEEQDSASASSAEAENAMKAGEGPAAAPPLRTSVSADASSQSTPETKGSTASASDVGLKDEVVKDANSVSAAPNTDLGENGKASASIAAK